jgi:hypothetical protein
MQIGNINLPSEIIQHEYRIGVLEQVVDRILRNFPRIGGLISEIEMMQIRKDVVAQLQRKYPESGIKLEGL